MATFRVGQRVRIKWSEDRPELAGETGVIKSELRGVPGHDWVVAPDCWGTPIAPSGKWAGLEFAPASCQLEPILPDKSASEHFRELMEKIEFGVELPA